MKLYSLGLIIALLMMPVTALADKTSDRYRKSYLHEAQANYAEALADIDGLPKAQRTTYIYQVRRGWLLYLLGRHWDSIEAYRAAIDIHPQAVEPRLGLMLPKMALRLWLDVVETGKGIVSIDPLNYTANARMAWANYSLGRYGDAEQLYRTLLDAYPSDVEMRAGLGWSLLKQQRYGEARQAFEAVLIIAPDHASAKAGQQALPN